MKKIKFNVFLHQEIDKIKEIIEKIEVLKSKLRNEAELLISDPTKRSELSREYVADCKSKFINPLKRISDKTLIEFYIKKKEEEYQNQIQELNIIINDIQSILPNHNGDTFIKAFVPSESTIKYLIKYGKDTNQSPSSILTQLLLLSKISIITDKKDVAKPMVQYLIALSKIINDDLTYPIADKKAIEFIFRKINSTIYYDETEKQYEQFLLKTTSSLDEHVSSLTEEDKTNYRQIVDKNNQPKILAIQSTLSKINELSIKIHETATNSSELTRKLLTSDQILIIHEAFKIAEKEKSRGIVAFIHRAINDITSICKFIAVKDQQPVDVEDLESLNKSVDFLNNIVKNYKNQPKDEPLFYYLANRESGHPVFLESARSLEETLYPLILETLPNLDQYEQNLVYRKKRMNFYEVTNSSVTILIATYKDNIIVINCSSTLTKKPFNPNYYDEIIEQFKKKIDTKAQKLYSSLIKHEIDLSFYPKEEVVLTKKDWKLY